MSSTRSIAVRNAFSLRRSFGLATTLVAVAACATGSAASAQVLGQGSAPLAAGELFHTYATTFAPRIGQPKGAPMLGDPFQEVPWSYETWIDMRGRGQALHSNGASSIHFAPVVQRDENGHVVGIGGNTQLRPGTTRALSLLYANSVNLLAWPTTGAPFQRAWVRTKDGYEKTYDAKLRGQSTEARVTQQWGASPRAIAALPLGGPALTKGVRRLVEAADPAAAYGLLPTGARGETIASRQREQRIDRAIRMLGNAPLSEHGRRAVVGWLVAQPGAQVHRGILDRAGRRGTSVTFSRVFDREVSARTVTATQLIAEARAAGVTGLPDTTSTQQWSVEAHREYRRWLVGIVYDPKGSQLLQSYSITQASFPVREPQVTRRYGTAVRGEKAYRFDLSNGGGASSVTGSGALLWGAHERVRSMTPLTPVCSRHPEVCR